MNDMHSRDCGELDYELGSKNTSLTDTFVILLHVAIMNLDES